MSHIRLAQRVLIGITPFVLAFVFTSCIFSPHKDPTGGGPPPPKPYPALTDPYNVLYALKAAYENRDSLEIKAVYDTTYQGTSFDPATLNPLPAFTRQDEIRHVEALYRTTSITSVSFTLPPSLFRETDLSDAPWATIRFQNMNIEINDSPTSYNLVPNGTWEYKFIPTTPDSTSPTDTTWKIVRWTELP